MSKKDRKLAFLCFQGFQSLDLSGPMEVFAQANRHAECDYQIHLMSVEGGLQSATSGMQVWTQKQSSLEGFDSLIMVGGNGITEVCEDRAYLRFIAEESAKVSRIISVCSGSLALAKAGLLDGKRATSHWSAVERLAEYGKGIIVEPDSIFVKDGNTYTSAGVTAGMDLALAIVEEDHGREIAMKIAKNLVIFYRRQGGQSQYSEVLKTQALEDDKIRSICDYIRNNVDASLGVSDLAAKVNMSDRNFSRIFTKLVGNSPGKFVELARIEVAKLHLENSNKGMDTLAQLTGFSSADVLRRVFYRHLNVSPTEYRLRFGTER